MNNILVQIATETSGVEVMSVLPEAVVLTNVAKKDQILMVMPPKLI